MESSIKQTLEKTNENLFERKKVIKRQLKEVSKLKVECIKNLADINKEIVMVSDLIKEIENAKTKSEEMKAIVKSKFLNHAINVVKNEIIEKHSNNENSNIEIHFVKVEK